MKPIIEAEKIEIRYLSTKKQCGNSAQNPGSTVLKMIKRTFFFCVLLLIVVQSNVLANLLYSPAQTDTTIVRKDTIIKRQSFKLDSATLARRKVIKDSLKAIGDSLTFVWIKAPDPNRPNKFVDSLIKLYKIEKLDFAGWVKKFAKKKGRYDEGKIKSKGEKWVIVVLLLLIVFFGILKKAFSKELMIIMESFYSNRILGQINKEDNLFSSWPFISLYLLFGLTIGMFLYLASNYLHLNGSYSGIQWYLILSCSIIILFTCKIVALRILGFFFGIQKLVKTYISILYLSYFNLAIIFLPLVIVFSLTPYKYSELLSYIAFFIILLTFVFQFIRAGINILSTYQFPKVYLIIYLCALEICPLLILIKALRI